MTRPSVIPRRHAPFPTRRGEDPELPTPTPRAPTPAPASSRAAGSVDVPPMMPSAVQRPSSEARGAMVPAARFDHGMNTDGAEHRGGPTVPAEDDTRFVFCSER